MQKGLCPVSFLWRGQGLGGFLIKLSIAMMLALLGLGLLGFGWPYGKEAALIGGTLWLVGKLFSLKKKAT